MGKSLKQFDNLPWFESVVTGGFWKNKQEINANNTIPGIYTFFKSTGRMDCMKALYRENPDGKDILRDRANGKEEGYMLPDGKLVSLSLSELLGEEAVDCQDRVPRPHAYWDSDVAKWIEAASYALRSKPDPEVERIIDEIVDEYEKLQFDDGYLNSYYSVVDQDKRFSCIWLKHEFYCAGHLLEAAIAYYQVTSKEKFLNIIKRYIDLIYRTFGPEEGQISAYPGHQEIELALMKLYRLQPDERYLRLAKYFIDARGQQPYFYDEECRRGNINPNKPVGKGYDVRDGLLAGPYAEVQSHLPVREQKEAVGHAVRMVYMGTGMADVAAESGDTELLAAAETLWNDITRCKMSVTGGIGASAHGERFAFSYHLPNENVYNETCASIGMAMWSSRMLQMEANAEYADILERELYNNIISGVSLDGRHFFYANHLQCEPQMYYDRVERQTRMMPVRQKDFPVSCCPTNIARLIASITGYAFTYNTNALYVHLYMQSKTEFTAGGKRFSLEEETNYPDEGTVRFRLKGDAPAQFTLGLRIPGWCDAWTVAVNGENQKVLRTQKGYVELERLWKDGDTVCLHLDLTPYLLEAHPQVRMNCGKVAIARGPVIYCLEEADNADGNLFDIVVSRDAQLEAHYDPDLLGGCTYITAPAIRRREADWDNVLYKKLCSVYEPCEIKAIPYYLWSNRGLGRMAVWLGCR